MTLRVKQTIPLLRIFDVQRALEFYVDFLGFRVDWEHKPDSQAPTYIQVSLGSCVLHLTEHHGDCCPGATVLVSVTGIEQYHQEITSKGYGHMRPGIESAPWNAKLMEVIDPFGNRLRFSEDIS